MRVAITADHNGVHLKQHLLQVLASLGYDGLDVAPRIGPEEVDYPPLCLELCRRVLDRTTHFGVVVGGSGQGEAITCNKVPGIRAGLCWDVWTAQISRGNNDANVLVLGAKVLSPELAADVMTTWLGTPFKGGVHARRVAMIGRLERGESLT